MLWFWLTVLVGVLIGIVGWRALSEERWITAMAATMVVGVIAPLAVAFALTSS